MSQVSEPLKPVGPDSSPEERAADTGPLAPEPASKQPFSADHSRPQLPG